MCSDKITPAYKLTALPYVFVLFCVCAFVPRANAEENFFISFIFSGNIFCGICCLKELFFLCKVILSDLSSRIIKQEIEIPGENKESEAVILGYDQDHGYLGKGLDGYVHYKQAFDRSSRSSGGCPGPDRNAGCLTMVIYIAILLVISIFSNSL